MTTALTDVWPGMPRATFDATKAYLADIASTLRLRDWTIELSREPADDDALASVAVTYGRRCATVRIARDFATHDPDVQRQSLTHELLHCHLDPIEATLREVLPELIGSSAWNALRGPLHRDIEMATDTLADAIAPLLPAAHLLSDQEGQ